MYKIKELFLSAYRNQKGRKKYTRTIFFLMFVSMSICIGVNSIVKSIDDAAQGVVDKPLGRLLQIIDNSDDESLMNQIKENLEPLDMTGDIIRLIPFIGALWKNTDKILYSESASINLLSYFSGLDKYGMNGKYSNIEAGEILIPEYLYGMGDYSLYEYTSGSSLIGNDMTVSIHNYYNDEDYEYTFRIVGTYDNIHSSCINDMFFINDIQADKIYTQRHAGIEKEIEEQKEIYKDLWEQDPSLFDNYYTKHYIGVYVQGDYNTKDMQELLQSKMGMHSEPMQFPDESLLQYYQMILKISRVIVFMILTVAFISLVITIVTDLRQRTKEIAVDFAMGYQLKNIIAMFAFEKAIVVFQSGLAAFLCTGAAILGGNYFIQKCLPFYRRIIELKYDWKMVGTVFLILVLAALTSLILTALQIRKINLVTVMKSE